MHISLSNIAHIASGELTLGDLTLIIGQQASGKSIFLQLVKLLRDNDFIKNELKSRGFDWDGKLDVLQQLYWGEGYKPLDTQKSKVFINKRPQNLDGLATPKTDKHRKESVFYIPAQRVLSLEQGFPKAFHLYNNLDPFTLKWFSESLNKLMQQGLGSGKGNVLFPQEGRFKKEIRERIQETIYGSGQLKLTQQQFKKEIRLAIPNANLPFLAWSAGQREFTPLLLGLYWLMPSSRASKKPEVEYIIIEEPEMGLHPYAIESLVLVFLDLIDRGYKLIISTHSPTLLEAVWALKQLQKNNALDEDACKTLFNISSSAPSLKKMFSGLQEKELATYFFNRTDKGVEVKDISSLSALDDDPDIVNWGGITGFSDRANEAVIQSVNRRV